MLHWITEQLGTSAWGAVKESPSLVVIDVRDLVDKGGNAPSYVRSKIDEALTHLRGGRKVVVTCDYGMSRSNAVAAGILALSAGISLEEAIGRVVSATGETSIRIEVLTAIRKAVGVEVEGGSMSQTERRLLVTGGSGFVGSSLVGELGQSYVVTAPRRLEVDVERDAVGLDQLVRTQRIDTIVHLANPRIYGLPESMGKSLVMLKNVLDVCVENGLYLVYMSSWEMYSGYKARELRADESLPPFPGGTYGETKLLSETLIQTYHRRRKLTYLIVRSSPLYGPGSDRPKFIWNFLDKALRNQDIVTHRYINGFPALDLLYEDDLRAAVVAAIEGRVQGEMNLGTGVGTSTSDVARLLVEMVGSRSAIRHHEIEAYVGNIVMDAGRANTMLGWRPKVMIGRGLEIILETSRRRAPGKG